MLDNIMQINIKNRLCYLCNDMVNGIINIKNLTPHY